MLDQMFNAKNFRQIYDAENRKGVNVASRYFARVHKYNSLYRRNVEKISDLQQRKRNEEQEARHLASTSRVSKKKPAVIKNKKNMTARNKKSDKLVEKGKSKQVKRIKFDSSQLKSNQAYKGVMQEIDNLNEQINALKINQSRITEKKLKAIDDEMTKLGKSVANRTFKLTLIKKVGPRGRDIYCIRDSAEAFFVTKLLQRNLRRLYKVKQSNRHELACRVRDAVDVKFPFELVRADIKSFYESIDRKDLYKKIYEDPLLSMSSKLFIGQIFKSYSKKSKCKTGVPRGVGISAYLAEIYLRQIDESIKQLPGIILFCRYVDDILAIFVRPTTGDEIGSYKEKIRAILKSRNLTYNEEKTVEHNLENENEFDFDYLGYRFLVRRSARKSNLQSISLSRSSVCKLRHRLDVTFRTYSRIEKWNSRKAFRDTVKRLMFLTGNTRLTNNKSGTLTGIYYNNPLVTDFEDFDELDQILMQKICVTGKESIENRFSSFSFTKGFNERRFHRFNVKQLKQIVSVWKHVKE